MKNWLPSLVKNLEPLAEMVGRAATEAASAVTATARLNRMLEGLEDCYSVVLKVRKITICGDSDAVCKQWSDCETK